MIKFDFSFSACFVVNLEMTALPCQCPGTAGKVCTRFLPAKDKDPHLLCTNCRHKECNAEDLCGECHNWSDEMWIKVIDFISKLAAQREKKEERKVKSSSLSGFLSSKSILLSELSGSLDSAGISTVASSTSLCTVTYAMSSQVVLVRPFISPTVSVSGELSRKRSQEGFHMSSVSREDSWSEFRRHGHRDLVLAQPGIVTPACPQIIPDLLLFPFVLPLFA